MFCFVVDDLYNFFSHHGSVVSSTLLRESDGRSRGFGFIIYSTREETENVLRKGRQEQWQMKGKEMNIKLAEPKESTRHTTTSEDRKLFVGALAPTVTDEQFREHFAKFGQLVDSVVIKDRTTGVNRGFGYIQYASEVGMENCLSSSHEFDGQIAEVRKAVSKQAIADKVGHQRADRHGRRGKQCKQH